MSTTHLFSDIDVSKLHVSAFKDNSNTPGKTAYVNYPMAYSRDLFEFPVFVSSTGAMMNQYQDKNSKEKIGFLISLGHYEDYDTSVVGEALEKKKIWDKTNEMRQVFVKKVSEMKKMDEQKVDLLMGTPIRAPSDPNKKQKYGYALSITIPTYKKGDTTVFPDNFKVYDEKKEPYLNEEGLPLTPHELCNVFHKGCQVKVLFNTKIINTGQNFYMPFYAQAIFIKRKVSDDFDFHNFVPKSDDGDFFSVEEIKPLSRPSLQRQTNDNKVFDNDETQDYGDFDDENF